MKNPRVRNSVLSLIAVFAALLVTASIALLTETVAADYIRTSIGMYVVTIISLAIIVIVTLHENDQADKIWVGFIFGVMAAISLIAGIGINVQVFATPALAQSWLVVTTGIDAIAASGYWVYTNFFNDDFVS